MTVRTVPIQVLPARMSLAPDAVRGLQLAILPFPYTAAVNTFVQAVTQALNKKYEPVPWRRLSNLMLATAPALAQGFEWYTRGGETGYRALVVGTPNRPFSPPPAGQVYELIDLWARDWTRRLTARGSLGVQAACADFLEQINAPSPGWDWHPLEPDILVSDPGQNGDLGYAAIPALLASLLHGQEATIGPAGAREVLRWRRVIGFTPRDGAGVVSQPFPASYRDEYGKEHRGYFAYTLNFRVQTQAGRRSPGGPLQPCLFVTVSCRRYAHEPLVEGNYGRNTSVLVGMNEARLTGSATDSTLVRLVLEPSIDKKRPDTWADQLTDLLGAFQVRSLLAPSALLADPAAAGNLTNAPEWKGDEYYLIHAEGYRYGSGRGHGHAIKTGYSFQEQSDLIAGVLELLDGRLLPDAPWPADHALPRGDKRPAATRDYAHFARYAYPIASERKSLTAARLAARRATAEEAVQCALNQALAGHALHLLLIWREASTREVLAAAVRRALLLQDGDPLPNTVRYSEVHIDDAALLTMPPSVEGLTGADYLRERRKQHEDQRDLWRAFLRRNLPPVSQGEPRVAIIELGRNRNAGELRGPIRDACVRESIVSQCVRPINYKTAQAGATSADLGLVTSQDQGRALNVALEAVVRHLGALYGSPSAIYRTAGVPNDLAEQLDVIALYRLRTGGDRNLVDYAVAVRLCSDGRMEVYLPGGREWISYVQAAVALGQRFAEGRGLRYSAKNPLNLHPGDLAAFAAGIVTASYERPTLVLVDADNWRQGPSGKRSKWIWPQLKNENLAPQQNVLDLAHVSGHSCVYHRNDPSLHNLVAVIRLRHDDETPHYVPNRATWTDPTPTRDFAQSSGFCDTSVRDLFHYFSAGRLPDTQRNQNTARTYDIYMREKEPADDPRNDEYGANIAFKHPQLVELVPFFVRPDLAQDDVLRALCRVAHYLRLSPAWTMGNTVLPYPMHLGQQLIADQLPILGLP